MLPNKGIVITVGPVDIGRCHWIKNVEDELKIKNESYMMLKEDFEANDLHEKVR